MTTTLRNSSCTTTLRNSSCTTFWTLLTFVISCDTWYNCRKNHACVPEWLLGFLFSYRRNRMTMPSLQWTWSKPALTVKSPKGKRNRVDAGMYSEWGANHVHRKISNSGWRSSYTLHSNLTLSGRTAFVLSSLFAVAEHISSFCHKGNSSCLPLTLKFQPDNNSVRCLFNVNRESRYLLVLTENYGALPIVQQELYQKGEEPVVIFGSSFPKDQEYTQVPTNSSLSNRYYSRVLSIPFVWKIFDIQRDLFCFSKKFWVEKWRFQKFFRDGSHMWQFKVVQVLR